MLAPFGEAGAKCVLLAYEHPPQFLLFNSHDYGTIGAMSVPTNLSNSLTVTEAAEYLEIEGSVVRRYLLTGRLRGTKFAGVWAIDRKELDRFRKLPRPVGNPNFVRSNG